MRADEVQKQIEIEKKYFYFKNKRELVLSVLKKILKKSQQRKSKTPKTNANAFQNILEIGPGAGILSEEIKKQIRHKSMDGIEIDKNFYETLKKKKIFKNLYNKNFEAGHSSKQKYDLIILLDVLEHIKNDNNAVKSLYNLNSKEGYLILTVPAYQSLFSYHDVVLRHHRRYSMKNLKKMLKEHKYTIKKSTYFNSYALPLLFVMRKIINTKRTDSDTGRGSFFNGFFRLIGKIEMFFINLGIKIPFGTSILIVCKKE